jgi:hypothetical protein
VPFPVDLGDLSAARGQNLMIDGIYCQAVASHSLRENRIGNILEGNDRTGQGSIKNFHLYY